MSRRKPNHVYRVIDTNNGCDLTVTAKSVSHAAHIAGRQIAFRQRIAKRKYLSPLPDHTTGGWHGLSIDLPTCVHTNAGRPTPRPESPKKLWKNKPAVAGECPRIGRSDVRAGLSPIDGQLISEIQTG